MRLVPEGSQFFGRLVTPLTAWWRMVGGAKSPPGIWEEKPGE